MSRRPSGSQRGSRSGPELSIVVPLFDEEHNVEPVASEIEEVLAPRIDYELILVDDGSRDDTRRTAERICASRSVVRLVVHGSNRGLSAALVSGVEVAHAPWIATMDGDGQNDPRDVLRFLDRIDDRSRPLALIGERRLRRDSWSKRVSSLLANRVRAAVLRDDSQDSACGLRVFRRADFLSLPTFKGMHRFLPALFAMHDVPVRSLPIHHRARWSGRSKYGFWNRVGAGVVDLVRVLWWQRRLARDRPDGVQEALPEPRARTQP